MKTLKDFNFENKKVLVRCDFNVSFSDKERLFDDFRIKETLPTINYLIGKKAKVILISHLDDPSSDEESRQKYSFSKIAPRIEELLSRKIKFVNDCKGPKVKAEIEKLKSGEIILLENLRFYKQEKENDLSFAKELAELAEIYVNEAFSASHRSHASIVGIPQFLPHCAGLLLEKEMKVLSEIKDNPPRPMVVIIGGAKSSSKIRAARKILEKTDHLLLGGKIANDILVVKKISLGKSWPEDDVIEEINKIDLTSQKVHLPIDVVTSVEGSDYGRQTAPGLARKEEDIFDIGPETVKIYSEVIKTAKLIVWAGPLGLFEDKRYEKGTKEIADRITRNYSALKVVGGGETAVALFKFGLSEEVNHISTGGGAMLEFLSGDNLPGILALNDNEKS